MLPDHVRCVALSVRGALPREIRATLGGLLYLRRVYRRRPL